VLGAGACGLTAAWHLAKNGIEVDVIEAEPLVVGGGHASTIKIGDELYADLAPHAFHIKKSEGTSLVEELMGPALRRVRSDTQMRIKGRNFDFHLNVPNLLRGLNPFISTRIVFDCLIANLKSKIFDVPERSFADWCTKRFGRTLSDLCFLNYTEKVWGRSPSELSSALAKQKLVKLNLKDLFVKLIGFGGQEQPVYFRKFYYPEQGIGQLWNALANDIKRQVDRIHLEFRAAHVEPKERRVAALHVRNDTMKNSLDTSWIVSTVPITTLVEMVRSVVPRTVQTAANSLRFRSLILLYVIIRKERVLKPQWIYFLDNEFTFNRVSDQKTMSEKMLPPGRTILCMEKNCDFNDDVWNTTPEEHLTKALEELEQAKLISRDEVDGYNIAKIRNAYPVFDLGFQNNLSAVMQYFEGVENLLTVGRPGLYLNNDMHDSMEMGLMAARHVLECIGRDKTSRRWYEQISAYKDAKEW